MVSQSFFLAVAVVSSSLAGLFTLALLMHANGEPGRLTAWRIRMIVRFGLGTTIAALAVVAIGEFVDTDDAFVRWATVAALVRALPSPWMMRSVADPEVFRTSQERTMFQVASILVLALPVLNLVLASSGLLVIIFVLQVFDPISVVLAFTAQLYAPPATVEAPSP